MISRALRSHVSNVSCCTAKSATASGQWRLNQRCRLAPMSGAGHRPLPRRDIQCSIRREQASILEQSVSLALSATPQGAILAVAERSAGPVSSTGEAFMAPSSQPSPTKDFERTPWLPEDMLQGGAFIGEGSLAVMPMRTNTAAARAIAFFARSLIPPPTECPHAVDWTAGGRARAYLSSSTSEPFINLIF